MIRDDVVRLVTAHRDAVDRQVRACPEWTVRDTVAHLTGNCRMALGGGTGRSGPPDPEWTRQQVASFRGTGVGALLDMWREAATELERRWAGGTASPGLLLIDATVHRFDIGVALGEPPPERHPVLAVMLAVAAGGFGREVASRQLPGLRLRTDAGQEWSVGMGEPSTTVRATQYDLFRSLTGRRTLDQIAALDWDADPAPWLPAFRWGPFGPPTEPAE